VVAKKRDGVRGQLDKVEGFSSFGVIKRVVSNSD